MLSHGYERAVAPYRYSEPHQNDIDRILRRAFDISFASVGLIVLFPIVAVTALAIKLDDGGPIFYRQPRVGKDLRLFRLLKFRSMFDGCPKGCLLTGPSDPRVTRVGRLLRRYKLDELPQLLNVLRGEMRFVGVRPQVQRFVEIYRTEYEELLQEAPGLTGIASLCFRNEEDMYEKGRPMEEQYIQDILPVKLQLALAYARTRTFRSDLEIILRTVFGLRPPLAERPAIPLNATARPLAKSVPRSSS